MAQAVHPIEFDVAQQVVVAAPIDDRLLVIAAAGQGKTEVVAGRIDYLIREEALSASAEVLVLSFSRAAVDAVRRRLELREVAQANIRTFDSFANSVLVDAGIEPVGSYDARIRQATAYLKDLDELPPELEDLRHVVIDEIQDLVGDRADFVLTLLRLLDESVGITALGDPLQGIYNFQLNSRKSRSKTTFDEVFEALRVEYGATKTALGVNYRARGRDPKRVIELGERLRSEPDAVRARTILGEFDSDLLDLGSVNSWAGLLAGQGPTAVLCMSNAEVLRSARSLRAAAVDHVVRRSAGELGAAAWIAQAVASFQRIDVTRDEVEAALASLPVGAAPDGAWYLLKEAEGVSRNRNSLNLLRLNRLIRSGAIPLTLVSQDTADVVVSTVHRAKGLEFDRVFLVDPVARRDGEEDEWPSIRTRYVGLSRARDKVHRCQIPPPRERFEEDRRLPERILERVGKTRRTRSMEFLNADLALDAPFGDRSTAVALQREFARGIGRLSVEGFLDPQRESENQASYLFVTEDGRTIGRSSPTFDATFRTAFGNPKVLPNRLFGLSVSAVESVAGDPRATAGLGMGAVGIWLAPRLVGMLQPDWQSRKGDK
ncbi:ATP-dependent helicase [Nocardia acidivorans]|uniref:ATP-dependent helicase n=1 Tax=Nocardia acidivorans TaxID=404580 RepID=UPI0008355CEE|nr:ATP-dependent helicase [Nocardia acidivorans]